MPIQSAKLFQSAKLLGANLKSIVFFLAQKYCYSHGPKERKACIKCKGRTASRLGKLCPICFNDSGGEEKGKRLCRVYGSRTPTKIGGRREKCVIEKKTLKNMY